MSRFCCVSHFKQSPQPVSSKWFFSNPFKHDKKTFQGELKKIQFRILVHPRKLTWNLKMNYWKRRFLLKTIIFRFHVNLRGCNCKGIQTYPAIPGTHISTIWKDPRAQTPENSGWWVTKSEQDQFSEGQDTLQLSFRGYSWIFMDIHGYSPYQAVLDYVYQQHHNKDQLDMIQKYPKNITGPQCFFMIFTSWL